VTDRTDPYPDRPESITDFEPDDFAEPVGSSRPREAPEVERLLRQIIDIVEAARPVPLSASSMINKDELLEMLNDVAVRLPDELRAARWLLKEREDFLARVRREGDELMELARARAEQMVQRTEVVKSAEARARVILEQAETRARRLRLEAEDYCDQKLGSFEAVLERTLNVVSEGRSRLQGDPLAELAADEADEPAVDPVPGFYDQDQD
jgi:cell division septum initiation protein DivIVA